MTGVTARFEAQRAIAFLRELRDLTGQDDRLAWSDAWTAARKLLIARFDGLPVTCERDPAGNLWVTLEGERHETLVVGSHLDAVPGGGWLDGALGVAAGAELLRASAERGQRPPLTLALVDWADEEGVRFGQAMFGSGVATGALDPEALAGRRDARGLAIEDVLRRHGVDLADASASNERLRSAIAYLELHIEQGPVLDEAGWSVAPVRGTVAVRRVPLTIRGHAEHVGPAPLERRRDAVLALAHATLHARVVAERHGGRSAVTVVDVEPNVPTVIAGHVSASVDLRHEDDDAVDAMVADLRGELARVSEATGCRVVAAAPSFQAPASRFDDRLVAHAAEAAVCAGGTATTLISGALHDATHLSRRVPTAMLFAGSIGGLSHCRQEDTADADLVAALDAFADLSRRTIVEHLERSPA